MKITLTLILLLLSITTFSQKSITAVITEIAIEEIDGSNSPYIEFVDSSGTVQFHWFQLYYHPMGNSELMLDETSVMYCLPDETFDVPQCYYQMNEDFLLPDNRKTIIQYEEYKNDMGSTYWVITKIETVNN